MKRTLAMVALLSLLAGCLAAAQEKQQEKQEKKEASPGPLTGIWKCVGKIPERPDGEFQLDLDQRGEEVKGTGSNANGSAPLKGTFNDGKFKFVAQGGETSYAFEGTLDGDKISGTFEVAAAGIKGSFEGTRKKD